MGIDVEGHGNRTMPEHGLHHLGRHALFQEPGRKGVPRIVQAEGGAGPPQRWPCGSGRSGYVDQEAYRLPDKTPARGQYSLDHTLASRLPAGRGAVAGL